MNGALARHGLNPFGYISLESQLNDAVSSRNNTGKVLRKPLKGRKRIDAKSSRIIPILERQTFNVLAKRFNEQSDLFLSKAYGSDRGDYLLFNGLGKNRFSRLLREAYQIVRLNPKSPHCCRHTYATNFAGIAHADTMLCRLVLGHKDEDTTLGCSPF